jgi:hypothetical protein
MESETHNPVEPGQSLLQPSTSWLIGRPPLRISYKPSRRRISLGLILFLVANLTLTRTSFLN